MAWIVLVVAGLLEIGWAVGLKYTEGFRRPAVSVAVVLALVASVALLERAARELPIGTAYAVWVGIGALGTAVLGMAVLQEPVTGPRLFFLLLLTVSIVGLKLA